MVQVEFEYEQVRTIIQVNLTDTFSKALQNYKNKRNINLENKFFVANAKNIQKTDIIKNIMSSIDKRNKSIKVLVYDDEEDNINNNPNLIKSKDIVCPECKEICKFEINNYKIKFYGCKNVHIKENIPLSEFNSTQYIDISKIICGKCKSKNKSETFNNEFYKCYECKMNLCPLCKSSHDKNHSIINYDSKNYICNKHNEILVKYCEDCAKDICFSCANEHRYHKCIYYDENMVDVKEMRKNMNKLKDTINEFKINLEENIRKLNEVMKYMDLY